MVDLAQRYGDWKAPQEDGSALLWPDARAFCRDARDNHQSLNEASAPVQNLPLSELRRQMRLFLGSRDETQLLFLTGHQTELHHPGVWAKNVVIDAAARLMNGVAIHVAVDTDAPKHLTVRCPGFHEPLCDDASAQTAEWAQLVAAPTPTHLARLQAGIEKAALDWPFRPACVPLLETMRRQAADAEDLPHLLAASLHELDWSLGLHYSVMLASPIWTGWPYLALVHHLLANAGRLAADFNAALHGYRQRHRIRTPGRPMPELKAKEDRVETPFWRDDLKRGRRLRAWVERQGDAFAIVAGDDALRLDPTIAAETAADRLRGFLHKHELRLSPRALTLTMTLRLLAADQFVHGIGGAQYDQVTDDVIQRFFGIDPPRFSVATTSLFWPTAAGKRPTNIPALLHEGHELKHAALGGRKRALVAAIEAAPRHSLQRATLFQEMHQELDAAVAASPAVAGWQHRLDQARSQVPVEKAIFDREIFYALQPRERLEAAIQDIQRLFA